MKDIAHMVRGSATSPNRRARASESAKVWVAIERVLTVPQGERGPSPLDPAAEYRPNDKIKGRPLNGKRYSDEFKATAVRRVIELGGTVKDVAAELGISRWTLHRWLRVRPLLQADSLDSPKQSAEIQRLMAELRQVTEERDMLKKAAAYFAKQTA
ncbi:MULTISPECIES: transposase [Burkholderia cepacia complex]|uniref:Transposase n=1 Tax=Burkholderia cenocepacia TaxID=95486 RepID=A0ABD4UIX8_9BURK|nr:MULTISPECIES: transposase [Burkholderia cepacia complex]MCW3698178.1 transposase [Burkholderia cenocepacia]MCW3706031.1 transposase [Burkholderia cenocepacia]MCW3714272.1 transposase [Burkholderia cenocepacia]MCW3722338.1 transposase [Burkholderia cenocepacia]MCW3730524.1 transposase [Burkholderia cenocepacia]